MAAMRRRAQLVAIALMAAGCADGEAASPACGGDACLSTDTMTADASATEAFDSSARDDAALAFDDDGAGLDPSSSDVAAPDGSADDAGGGVDGEVAPECTSDASCTALMGRQELGGCEAWRCDPLGQCIVADATDGDVCAMGAESGRCAAGVCVAACGDGFVQHSVGEQCDDGDTASGDGCRDDCVIEEDIGAGWIGGQCQIDADCSPAGSFCVPDVGGGSCALPCVTTCPDQADAPVTFCIDATSYDPGASLALGSELSPALCVSKCDFDLFPRTGCRQGLHCELHARHGQSVLDEVCIPGQEPVGLLKDATGTLVTGTLGGVPMPQPYAKLMSLGCGSEEFEPISWRLLRALADTLLAMGPDGRTVNWERLCTTDTSIPDTPYGLHTEVEQGRAFRLNGARTEIIDWAAAGHYGTAAARGSLVGGPLWSVRTMVYRDGDCYLYADDAVDLAYPWYPERGRDFAMVEGDEWEPVDVWLVPGEDFVTAKANKGDRFQRQWGRADVVAYTADMALAYWVAHGELLGIGDLSYATGGDIDDHASHELGRDVDIYLVTSEPSLNGIALGSRPWLWVSQCASSGCFYIENDTGELEDLGDPEHVPAALLLETLAQHAFDFPGPTHFVHHDVDVLAPFGSLSGLPTYIHADNAAASGWPPHQNHIHMRFPL